MRMSFNIEPFEEYIEDAESELQDMNAREETLKELKEQRIKSRENILKEQEAYKQR